MSVYDAFSDIWVNWFEGEENGYNVCDFFEWRANDSIELLDLVQAVKVEPEFFTCVENSLELLPDSLLELVRNKSVVMKNNNREIIEYAFIISDGIRCLAVDTLGYAVPTRKSRLIPRHERRVLERMGKLQVMPLEIPKWHAEPTLVNPSFRLMVGLNRHERTIKQILLQAIDYKETSWGVDEAKYWYKEFTNNDSLPSKLEGIHRAIEQAASMGWSKHHEELTHSLIQGNSYFEALWEQEESFMKTKAR